MNYVTASITLMLVFLIGYKVSQFEIKIEKVAPGTPVAESGLKPGDQIVALNGKPVQYADELMEQASLDLKQAAKQTAKEDPAQVAKVQFHLTVDRAGKRQTLDLAPMDKEGVVKFLGSVEDSLWRPAYVDSVVPNMPAEKAGLKKGDQIVAINGTPVTSFSQAAAIINQNPNKEISLRVQRGSQFILLNATPVPGVPAMNQDPKLGYINFAGGSPNKKLERVNNPAKAFLLAQASAYDQVKNIISMNVQFFRHATMKDVQKNITGPIGIAVITAKMAQAGVQELVRWFILLNLLLMIFNLLPLPVLDGGFILLAVIEGVIRRPVPAKVLAPIYTVFVVGFIILMVLISVQDLFNWIPQLFH
jgi:regulator of sigma E protease